MEIIDAAKAAREKAYAPYSNFRVGASILLSDNKYIFGCNVENVSYGLTICAERNALFQAIALGYKKEDIKAMAIVGDLKEPLCPCGACRQVMLELMLADCPVILANMDGKEKTTTVAELMPSPFEVIINE